MQIVKASNPCIADGKVDGCSVVLRLLASSLRKRSSLVDARPYVRCLKHHFISLPTSSTNQKSLVLPGRRPPGQMCSPKREISSPPRVKRGSPLLCCLSRCQSRRNGEEGWLDDGKTRAGGGNFSNQAP